MEETEKLLGESPKKNGVESFYGSHQSLVAERVSRKSQAKGDQPKKISVIELFRYADCTDKFLLALGSIFAFVHGAGLPILALVFGQMTNTFIQQATSGFAPDSPAIRPIANVYSSNIIAGPLPVNPEYHWVGAGNFSNNNGTTISALTTLKRNETFSTTHTSTAPTTPVENTSFSFQYGERLTVEEFAAYMTNFSMYYVYIGIAVFVASFMQVLCWEISCERQVYRLRQDFFFQVLRQEIAWFDMHQTGDLTTKLQDDLERVRDGIGHKFSMVMQFCSTFLAGFIVGFFVSWQLTLVILSLTPILAATSAFTGRMMASSSAREQEKYGLAGAVADEVIACIRTVASFGGQEREIKRYESALEAGRLMAVKKYVVFSWGIAVVFLVMYSAYALAFWYGSDLLSRGLLDPGTIFTVFFSVLVGAFSLGNAVPYVSSIGVAQGSAAVSYGIIDSIPFIDPYSKWGEKPERVEGRIEFRNVLFSYPTRKQVQILKDFKLNLEPGQTIALVGPSGSGKSTVVNLLLRFYDPERGQVLLDGTDIRNINLAVLRHHIGVVSQEPVLFGCSIGENIRYGRDDVTWDDIVKASKMANAHGFILTLPHGYDTLVGERGAQLSGGQKQRIAIARALVRNPRILLLDEATSALDAHSEGIVQAALNKAREGRTTIIIAHRLSTIKDADCIYVMKNGDVEEKGTHQDLMNKEGLYHELVTSQTTNEVTGFSSDAGTGTGYTSTNDDELLEKRHKRTRRSSSVSRTATPDRDLERLEMQAEEEEVKEPSVWRIVKMNLPEWPYLFIGVIGAAISGGIMPAFAYFYSEMFATFTKTGEELQEAAFFWSMMFLVLAATCALGAWLRTVGLAVAGEGLTMRLRLMSFVSVVRQSVSWFDEESHSGGRITTRLARDAPIVKQAAGHRVGLMLTAIVTIVAAMTIAFAFGWKLALVVMGGFPILAIAGYIQFRIQRGGQRKDAELLEEAGRIANESLQNVRTVQALTQEKLFFEKFLDSLLPAYMEARKQAFVYGLTFAFSEAVTFFMYAAAFRFGAYLVEIGESDPTSIYRVFFAISFCAVSVGQTTAFMPDYTKAKLAAGLMFNLIEMKPLIDAFSKSGNKPEVHGKVAFHDVHFSYPQRPGVNVLQGVNLTVEPGHSLALVGPSGCGKSTIVSLLQRFYDPQHGSLAIDDFDIRSLNLAHMRRQMGLVTQEPVLFDCSIRDNIAYGVEGDVSDDDIIKASRIANIHNFVCGLPRGYETLVGERGAQLSGGQKQRIAIARALIRDPKILLLDEATSALDTENEKIVQEALDVAMKGRTCIMIAHRLSTVQNADCIAVLDRGKIVEMGTHEELRAKRGLYYRLTKRQQITH